MIHYALFCILWAKPTVQLVEVPVSEYAMAEMNQGYGKFHFESTIVEERMNSVKITHLPTGISSESNTTDLTQKTLSTKLDLGEETASLDCEMREKTDEN